MYIANKSGWTISSINKVIKNNTESKESKR